MYNHPPEGGVKLNRDMKKTGIELIAAERQEQIEKHGYSIKVDTAMNKLQQLPDAAITLLEEYPHELTRPPMGWNSTAWAKMLSKPYKDRLIIAGALIAAEIDRLQSGEGLTIKEDTK